MLSLTEATSPEKEPTFTVKTQPWHEERKSMLETIASLKDLIAKMQIHKDSEVGVQYVKPGRLCLISRLVPKLIKYQLLLILLYILGSYKARLP